MNQMKFDINYFLIKVQSLNIFFPKLCFFITQFVLEDFFGYTNFIYVKPINILLSFYFLVTFDYVKNIYLEMHMNQMKYDTMFLKYIL